eukprot:12179042-Alexandrium_andersonii.AAC.1
MCIRDRTTPLAVSCAPLESPMAQRLASRESASRQYAHPASHRGAHTCIQTKAVFLTVHPEDLGTTKTG